MSRKTNPDREKFSKVKAVKNAAREILGAPKAGQTIPDAKTRAAARGGKHKKKLEELAEGESS